MSEMVERVARAIWAAQKGCGHLPPGAKGDADGPSAVGPSLVLARAAIAAMREPTEAMVDAGEGPDGPYSAEAPDAVWGYMIDEALR